MDCPMDYPDYLKRHCLANLLKQTTSGRREMDNADSAGNFGLKLIERAKRSGRVLRRPRPRAIAFL